MREKMREKIKRIPIIGVILTRAYECLYSVWKYITHTLLREQISRLRWNKIRREIIRDFSDSKDVEIKEMINNIKRQSTIRTFNYPFYDKYNWETLEVFYDYNSDGEVYPYIIHVIDGQIKKKIYFPKEWSRIEVAQAYYALLLEQDKDSPHCYTNDEFKVEDGAIILDLGVAEGNFSIELVDKVKHIYLFEGDAIWWKPLELTFREWKEKVTIIHKYVSDMDSEDYISLKSFFQEKQFHNERLFIKMDIEGYEERVLNGCLHELKEMLQETDVTMAVCSYHKQDSEEIIKELLRRIGFKEIKPSKGFMVMNNFCEERIYPYFRRGLLFAALKFREGGGKLKIVFMF